MECTVNTVNTDVANKIIKKNIYYLINASQHKLIIKKDIFIFFLNSFKIK